MKHLMLCLLYHSLLFSWNVSPAFVEKEPPLWLKETIKRDFNPFKEGFNSESVIHSLQKLKKMQGVEKAALVRIFFDAGVSHCFPLFSLSDAEELRLEEFLSALSLLHDRCTLPTLDFILCLGPSFNRPLLHLATDVPVFAVSKETHNQKVVLIPTFWDRNREFLLHEINVPWNQKKDKAFWRGSATDGPYGFADWDFCPRARIALMSVHDRDLLDASLIPSSHLNDYMTHWLKNLSVMGSFVSPKEQAVYKYLLAIDGKKSPSALEWQLFTGSVIFKTLSNQKEWFYDGLIPGIHYVSICVAGEDLKDKILWLREHDSQAQKIAENAMEFAQTTLLDEPVFNYFYHVLLEYSRLWKHESHSNVFPSR